jgi:small subunit ribosomal protein S16
VAVKIKLKRLGKIRAPYYRIVVADSRTKRDGRAIEEIGKYHPKNDPSFIEVDSERAQHWLSVGAQPTDPVRKILEITGDWQKFKGLPGTEGTLRVAEPKADRKIAFAAALQETLDDSGATTKGKARGKAAESATGKAAKPDPKADTAKADTAKADTAKADTAKADTAKADTAKPEKPGPGKADKPKAAAEPAAEAPTTEAEPAQAEAKAETAQAEAKAEPVEAKPEPAEAETKAETAPADAAADSASSEG